MARSRRSHRSKRRSKRSRSGRRSGKRSRSGRRHSKSRSACLKKKMLSVRRSGKIRCRRSRRSGPSKHDYLKSKTLKSLKRLAKSKGLKKYSHKKKSGLVRSILNA